MDDTPSNDTAVQDHAAFLAGLHDFQADIEILSGSQLIGTILETIMLATNMRFAAVARVTADRWVACRTVDEVNFGLLAGDEIEIRSTFCQSVRDTGDRVMFNDAATDEVYRDHPIAAKFGIVSYASIPIYRSNGAFFGTLCAIDTEPRDVRHPRVVAMLEMFAGVISSALETEEQLEAQSMQVERERELTRIQEEFIAVLGHDLRNPVAAFGAGLRQLSREPQSDRALSLIPMMRRSLHRMNELIDNIMMHARSRLGGGIQITPVAGAPLAQAIAGVVEEIRATGPEQDIRLDLALGDDIRCDAPRIAQAVSNMISNAISHGKPGTTIDIRGTSTGDQVTISVSNTGDPIPESIRAALFMPFQRGQNAAAEGLGLGLFIASSIATSHGGGIGVQCQNGLTTFTLSVPQQSAP